MKTDTKNQIMGASFNNNNNHNSNTIERRDPVKFKNGVIYDG
jgi:hypothetical protein